MRKAILTILASTLASLVAGVVALMLGDAPGSPEMFAATSGVWLVTALLLAAGFAVVPERKGAR